MNPPIMFSILIPSWNNLAFLKLCVDSIRRHSAREHEILVHVNDGSDGTLEWVRAQGLRHVHSAKNEGICLTVNRLAGLATRDWLVYLNDDMVCCPGWDTALEQAIADEGSTLAYLSPTLIEPTRTVNPLTIVQDFGRGPENFDEAALLGGYRDDGRGDLRGRASPVSVVHRDWWNAVGGYSLEFSPGMGSEDDLMMKFWVAGCRRFAVIGASRIYHFACRSTGRVRRNRGARTFVTKWGLTQGEFRRLYLERSADPGLADWLGEDALPRPTPLGRFKRAVYGLTGDFPLGDIRAWDPAPGVADAPGRSST